MPSLRMIDVQTMANVNKKNRKLGKASGYRGWRVQVKV
jgi:hypothetical protein